MSPALKMKYRFRANEKPILIKTMWYEFSIGLNSTTQSRLLTTLRKLPFENIVGKGENAVNLPKANFSFLVTFILLSANALNLDQPKKLSFGKELTEAQYQDLYQHNLKIDRGCLFYSVKDRNLFHWVDTTGNIFTRGFATRENITNGVHEMK